MGSQTKKRMDRMGSRERRRLYASGVADDAKDHRDKEKSKKITAENGKESTKEKSKMSKRSKEDPCSEEPPKKTKRKKKDAD